VFRADGPGLCLGLIARSHTYIDPVGSLYKRPSEFWLWNLNSLLNMWEWDEKFNVKYDLANFLSQKWIYWFTSHMVIFFANYLNPTIKTQKVFYIKNQMDQCNFWWAHLSGIYYMSSRDLPDIIICPCPRARVHISGKSLLAMVLPCGQ